jgi:hypothetical protein
MKTKKNHHEYKDTLIRDILYKRSSLPLLHCTVQNNVVYRVYQILPWITEVCRWSDMQRIYSYTVNKKRKILLKYSSSDKDSFLYLCVEFRAPSVPRLNSWTKSRKKSSEFSPCYSQSPLRLCLEISGSSNSRNLLQFL